MKVFIKKISVFLPLICLLVFVNYFEDPANIYKGLWYERDMAEIMLKGLNVANVTNFDERLLQKFYIEGLRHKKDIVVLGSSRSMQIGSSFFSDMEFFNNSVSGATIEDYIAIFEIYRQKKLKPKIVILGLDPWILNKNNGQTRWGSIADYYDKFMSSMEKLGRKSFIPSSLIDNEKIFRLKRYLQLFSLSYFQNSVKYLIRMIKWRGFDTLDTAYYPTDLTELDVPIKLFDGSFSYKNEHRSMPVLEVSKEAQRCVNTGAMYSLGEFYELDKELIFKFEKFVEILLDEDIEIIFFLPPYHPYIYSHLVNSNEYKIILEVESYFKKFASENNIYVIGSYNPAISGLDEKDFFDARHAKREAITRLFKKSW